MAAVEKHEERRNSTNFGTFRFGMGSRFRQMASRAKQKKEINEIVGWRNAIAYGDESYARNISLSSVQEKFRIACDLIDYLEKLILQASKSKKIVTAQGKS